MGLWTIRKYIEFRISENKQILSNTSFLIKDIEDYVGGVVDHYIIGELRKRNRQRNRKGIKWILSSSKHKVFVDQPRQFLERDGVMKGGKRLITVTDYAIEQLLKEFDPSQNKTKVISADLLEFDFDLDLNLYDIFRFCDISV